MESLDEANLLCLLVSEVSLVSKQRARASFSDSDVGIERKER